MHLDYVFLRGRAPKLSRQHAEWEKNGDGFSVSKSTTEMLPDGFDIIYNQTNNLKKEMMATVEIGVKLEGEESEETYLQFLEGNQVGQPQLFEKLSKNSVGPKYIQQKDQQFMEEMVFDEEQADQDEENEEMNLELCESLTNNTCEEGCQPLDFKKKKNQVCMHISPDNQHLGKNVWEVDPSFVAQNGGLRKKLKRKTTLNHEVNDSSEEFMPETFQFKSCRLDEMQKPCFLNRPEFEIGSNNFLEELMKLSATEPPKISAMDFEDEDDQYWGDLEDD